MYLQKRLNVLKSNKHDAIYRPEDAQNHFISCLVARELQCTNKSVVCFWQRLTYI